MSKLATLNRMRGVGDPALLGGILGFLGKKVLPAAGKLLGIGGAKKAALVASGAALPAVVKRGAGMLAGGAAVGGGMSLAEQVLSGVSGPGAPRRRRGRGITATELRGFRKVAGLLRKVGMVPKATRRRVR